MTFTDKIKFAVRLRLTPGNFFFFGVCCALAGALPLAAHLL